MNEIIEMLEHIEGYILGRIDGLYIDRAKLNEEVLLSMVYAYDDIGMYINNILNNLKEKKYYEEK